MFISKIIKYPYMTMGNGNDTGGSTGGTTGGTTNNSSATTCSSPCGGNEASIGTGTASAPGATQVNANHIIQYPRQPKMDDGKWISVASLVGAIIGKFANGGSIDKAESAENRWKDINEQLAAKGRAMFDRMPNELSFADKADNDLENQYNWNISQRDNELRRAEELDNCNNLLHEKICSFASCGYVPDYDGIKSRIMADVESQLNKSRKALYRGLNRYSARLCCNIETSLATTAISTTVSALYKAREDERARAWQINEGLLFKAGEMMEQHRNNRFNSANGMDAKGISIQQSRYNVHNNNYYELARLGADFLSSAGKNYAWLAESYRRTADKMSQDLSQLGGLLAVVVGQFLGLSSGENDCGTAPKTTTKKA